MFCFVVSLIAFCIRSSGTATFLNNHVWNVPFDYVVLVVEIEHRHGTQLGGNAAGIDRTWGYSTHSILIHYRCVERRGRAWHTCHVSRTAAIAIVAIVAGRCNDPVVPTYEPEIDVELLSATQSAIATVAFQATLLNAVFPLSLPCPHNQERSVRWIPCVYQNRHYICCLTTLTVHIQVLAPTAFAQG